MSCGTITRGSIATCDTAPGGMRARVILINFSDILKIYSNDDGKIVDIVLKSEIAGGIPLDFELDAPFSSEVISSSTAYEFLGFRNDVKKSEEVEKTSQHKKRFRHNLSFVVYEVDQVQKNNLKRLAKGRVLAIAETLGETEDSIEVLGRDCGLQIVAGQIRSAGENNVFIINLSTPDNGREYERKLPQTLGISYENGQDIIDDLVGEEEEPTELQGLDYSIEFTL